MSYRFSLTILIGMVAGVFVGWICHAQLTTEQAAGVAANLSIVTDVFLRLIKMIIAPLVFGTLVAGIANMGAGRATRPHRRAHDRLVPRRLGHLVGARHHHGHGAAAGRGLGSAAAAGRRA